MPLRGIPTLPSYASSWVASEELKASADTERSVLSETYVKVKEITLDRGSGTLRCKFDLKSAQSGKTVDGRIFKNGVAFGTEQTVSSETYETLSEDLAFSAGDKIQLYIKWHIGPDITVYARNFRIYGDETITLTPDTQLTVVTD